MHLSFTCSSFSHLFNCLSFIKEKDWDNDFQLQASDTKRLEKKKHPGKTGVVIGVVILAALVALMAGILVWHFHCKYISV